MAIKVIGGFVGCLIALAFFVFWVMSSRYSVSKLNEQAYVRLDRWTGATQVCGWGSGTPVTCITPIQETLLAPGQAGNS
jgi:hypothetical protein